jgi:DNA polymerase elongation subunit (family B)
MEKRKEFKNIILKMIEDGQNKGKDWEKVRSDEIVVKELGNSLYGIQGLEYGRYYSPDIAESITLFGHWLLEFTEDFFEKLGHEIVAGDTDSVFVKCKGELNSNEVLNNFHKTLNKLLKDVYNVNECHIILEPDKTYDNLIILAKKAYIGHITHNEGKKVDDIYTRGIDYIKRDTLSIAGDIQKELINLIFKDSSIDYLKKWIHDTKLNFYNKKFTKDELKISHKVGKDLKDYTARTLPLHIRLAKEIYEKTGKNLKSTEIEYIVVGTEPLIQGVLYDDFKDGDPFDIDYYWSKKVAALLKRVLIKVYPDENWNELLMDFKTIKEKKEKERLKKEKEEEKERLKKEQMIKRENIKKERIAKNEEKERLKKEKAEKREKIKRERAAEKEKNKKGRTKKIQKKLLI